jgi:hypothetical protein
MVVERLSAAFLPQLDGRYLPTGAGRTQTTIATRSPI